MEREKDIYIYRERERERDTHTHTPAQPHESLLILRIDLLGAPLSMPDTLSVQPRKVAI